MKHFIWSTGRASRQVWSEWLVSTGDSQHDGCRSLVSASRPNRQYGQRSSILPGLITIVYLIFCAFTSLNICVAFTPSEFTQFHSDVYFPRNSLITSISIGLIICAIRRRRTIPQSTIWPPGWQFNRLIKSRATTRAISGANSRATNLSLEYSWLSSLHIWTFYFDTQAITGANSRANKKSIELPPCSIRLCLTP